ncbi:hypothetical protein IWW48_004249 [Coemansia sp. RSA 1200]|nr:hypothetical protein IWW48_004249 [Coemansia sp. RSA 1200]
MIATLSWRDLGVLLAQLTETLELELEVDVEHRLVGALAIAVIHILDNVNEKANTGESGLSVGPVNSVFVASMFGTMVRACARCIGRGNGREEDGSWVVGLAVRSVARSLYRGAGAGVVPFDRDAVLAGITAGSLGTRTKSPLRPPASKRQRSVDPQPTAGSLVAALASALDGRQSSDRNGRRLTTAQKCAIRILRASGNHVIKHLADEVGRTGATNNIAIAKALTELCCALVARGCDAVVRKQQQQQQQQQCLGAGNQDRNPDNDDDDSLLTGDLFACIRDTVPLVPVASSVRSPSPDADAALERLIGSVSELANALVASVFRPLLVAAPKPKQNKGTGTAAGDLAATDIDSAVLLAPIYAECVGSRDRCYQWAALCRMATWLSDTEPASSSSAPLGRVLDAGPSLAAGRLCWLQILSSNGLHQTPGTRTTMSVWLLLLSESLAHVLGTYPQQQQQPKLRGGDGRKRRPLFLQTEKSQIRVFSAVASLLSMLPHQLRCIDATAETTAVASSSSSSVPVLLYSCVSSCEQLLLLVRPQAASMGLFWLHGPSSTVDWRRQRGEDSGGDDDGGNEREEEHDDDDDDEDEDEGGVLGHHGTSVIPANYVFGPPQQQQHRGAGGGRRLGDPDSLAADFAAGSSLERKVSEESQHEARIAGVFVGLDRTLQEIAAAAATMPSHHDGGNGGSQARTADIRQRHRVLVLCVRTALLWMRMFAAGARDNAGRQIRILEGLPSSGAIWINSDRIIVHKPATDWARLQRIPVASGSTSAAGVYRPAVARVLRFLMALAAWPFLADSTRCDVIVECLRQTPASNRGSATEPDPNGADAAGGRLAHSQCHGLASLSAASPRDLSGLAFTALQTLASIGGVRVRLFEGDPGMLRPPHVQVRDRAPPSSEALTHLAMRVGSTNLLLHPQLLARATSRPRCFALDSAARAFVALQMWLDLIGAVVRHSFFRSFLGARRFARWWCLALAASARHLVATTSRGADAGWLRTALTVPMHLASWQQHLATSGGAASDFTHLRPRPAADSSDNNISSANYWDAKLFGWLAALDQKLTSGVLEAASTPGSGDALTPRHPRSVLRIVYFCACRLWLSVPLLNGSSTQQQHPPMVLRVCRDVWGVAAEMLQFLARLLRQPAVRRRFVAPRSGLVDGFGSVLSTLALGPACYPSAIAGILRFSSANDDDEDGGSGFIAAAEAGEEYDGGGGSDLITIPLFDSPDSAAASTGADSSGSDGDGSAQESAIERLLLQAAAKHPPGSGSAIHHAQGSAASTLDDYYSRRMQRALWTNYTNQLQQLPSILLFSRPTTTAATASTAMASEPTDQQQPPLLLPAAAAALDGAGNTCDSACVSDSSHGHHHADTTRWLVDSDNVLRRLLAPLVHSANHRRLARRSHLAALWNAVACWFPQQCVLRTMREAAAIAIAAATQNHNHHHQQQLHLATEAEAEAAPFLFRRMCVSAAFLLPPPLSDATNDNNNTVSSMLECLVAQLVAEATEAEENNNSSSSNNGREDGGRGAAHDALLFLAWRHRDKVLHKVAVCARKLDRAAGMAVSKISEAWSDGGKGQGTVIMLSGYHREEATTTATTASAAGSASDNGDDGDSAPVLAPIPLALGFLVSQSRVFRAMLTGPFREAEAVDRTEGSMGQTASCSLHCSHATLADLAAIVRRCTMSSGSSHHHDSGSPGLCQLSAQLEVLYSAGRLANALHLAVVYDLRHLVVLLLWFFIDRLGRGIIPDPGRRSDDLVCLWLFSLLYRDNGVLSDALGDTDASAAAVDALGAAVLLCLDQVDTLDTIGSNAELFVSTLRFVLLDSE